MSGHSSVREVVEAVDGGAERAVGEEAERAGHDDRVFEAAVRDVRLADDRQLGARRRVELALHGGERAAAGTAATSLPCRSPVGKSWRMQAAAAGDDADAQGQRARARRAGRAAASTAPTRGDDEGAGHDRGAHGVRVLPERPRVERGRPRRRRAARAPVGADPCAHRMLHEGVGDDDEVAGQPRAEEEHDRRRRGGRAATSRFSPKRKRPRNADSAKKANMPSSASVRPMTPPA